MRFRNWVLAIQGAFNLAGYPCNHYLTIVDGHIAAHLNFKDEMPSNWIVYIIGIGFDHHIKLGENNSLYLYTTSELITLS
jgi:hypothetical protein